MSRSHAIFVCNYGGEKSLENNIENKCSETDFTPFDWNHCHEESKETLLLRSYFLLLFIFLLFLFIEIATHFPEIVHTTVKFFWRWQADLSSVISKIYLMMRLKLSIPLQLGKIQVMKGRWIYWSLCTSNKC